MQRNRQRLRLPDQTKPHVLCFSHALTNAERSKVWQGPTRKRYPRLRSTRKATWNFSLAEKLLADSRATKKHLALNEDDGKTFRGARCWCWCRKPTSWTAVGWRTEPTLLRRTLFCKEKTVRQLDWAEFGKSHQR